MQSIMLHPFLYESVLGSLPIISVAVCAGSGSSVLTVLRNVQTDLYVTGEMSPYEVLHAVYNVTSILV